MKGFQDKKAVSGSDMSAFYLYASLFSSHHPPQVLYFSHMYIKMYYYCHISHFRVLFSVRASWTMYFVIKQTTLGLVSKNSLSFKAFKVNGEVHMNCLPKTTSDPNPAVYTLFTYRCVCWQGSTRRRLPTTAMSVEAAPLTEGTWTYTRIHCPTGPRCLFALHLPSLTPSDISTN